MPPIITGSGKVDKPNGCRVKISFCLKDVRDSGSTFIYELAEDRDGDDGSDRSAGSGGRCV